MKSVADRVSSHSAQAQRIQELESALAGAIDYLRRLPKHPETYHAANAAEAVLVKTPGDLLGKPMNVNWQTMDGVTLIEGQLHGDRLHMQSPVMRAAHDVADIRWQKLVADALGSGLVIEFDATSGMGHIQNQLLDRSVPDDGAQDHPGKSQLLKEDFLRAVKRFAEHVGLEDLVRVGLPRKPWFYIELPEERYEEYADPLFHQTWWLLANLSRVFEQPGLAPEGSGISHALRAPNAFHHEGAIGAYAGPRLSLTEMGYLFDLLIKREGTEEATLLLNLINAYSQLT